MSESDSDSMPVFVSDKWSICYLARRRGYVSLWTGPSCNHWQSPDGLSHCLEVVNGVLSLDQAERLFWSYYRVIERQLFLMQDVVRIVIWNGSTVSGMVVRELQRDYGILPVFLEIANLPGKLFADGSGVNAQSSIFRSPGYLDNYDEPSDDEYEAWKRNYFHVNQKSSVPQAKLVKKINWLAALDYVISLIFRAPRQDQRGVFRRLADKFWKMRLEIPGDTGAIQDSYVFLPLQVSNDSQIKLNSDVDNIDAIHMAKKMAVTHGWQLVVKIHPAEISRKFIAEVVEVCRGHEVLVHSGNTLDLIRGSSHVVVINSTVGLEAMILGKELTIFGRAIYMNFNESRLKKYILRHLLPIDYFGSKNIPTHILGDMLKYSGFK